MLTIQNEVVQNYCIFLQISKQSRAQLEQTSLGRTNNNFKKPTIVLNKEDMCVKLEWQCVVVWALAFVYPNRRMFSVIEEPVAAMSTAALIDHSVRSINPQLAS